MIKKLQTSTNTLQEERLPNLTDNNNININNNINKDTEKCNKYSRTRSKS